MSDSDETVCGNESEEENTENSPSILSNWRKDETVFSTQKDKKSPKAENLESSDALNSDEMVPSPKPEISPEFPLTTRGLKRKETFDETDEATLDAKDDRSETNSTQIPDQMSSTESENISNTGIKDSESVDDDKRLRKFFTSVEDLVKDMELTSECNGNACNIEDFQNAKSQLSVIQKLLVESNHKNQAKRKMILSDAENSQQLSEEKKLAIVNLAKKQRNVLEAFKKYKNFVQRLRTIKDLNDASQRSGQLLVSSVEMSSKTAENQSTTTSKPSVSIPNSKSGPPQNNSVQCSSQNSQNVSITTSSVSTPSSRQHPDCFVQTLSSKSSQNLSTAPKASDSSVPRVVITNAANPGLAKAIQKGSVKFIVLQNQSSNLNQVPSQTQPNKSNSSSTDTTTVSMVTGSRQSTVRQSALQSVTTQHTSTAKDTFLPGLNNTIVSKQSNVTQIGTQNMTMKQSVSQTQTIVSTASSQSSKAPATYVKTSSMIQRNVQSSILHPSITTNQAPIPSNRPSTQATPNKTFSQTIATNPHLSAPKQSQPLAARASTNQAGQTIGVPMTSFPRSRVNQTYIRPSIATSSELSLETLVKKGILSPGNNVLTTKSEGKLYSASLSDKGTIISAGGEGFTSPRSWVKAVLGSKRKVKNELAWKMVSYKNKPLLDHTSTLTPEPTKPTETSINLNLEASQAHGPIQDNLTQSTTRRELINTTQALKALLSNCRVIGISKEEVLSSHQLQNNFWDNADMDFLNDDILKTLDF